nr:SDR family oxidoreductase [Neobacillus sp. Marseille-Q6967]
MKKHALITGASGGIGYAVAEKLASMGYHLYLHYNSNEKGINKLLEKLSSYGGEYTPIQADLGDLAGYKKVCGQIFTVDDIIHCGGISHYGLLVDLKEEEAQSLMNIHVLSPLMMTKELLPKLISKRSGNVIMISSIWGQTGGACEVAYSAAKGAQIAFVKALSKEVALNGIRVNAIAPGAIETRMMNEFSEEDLERIQFDIPMGRLGLPGEIANGVAFLLSQDSSYVTGQVLSINGGWYT